MQFPKDLGMDAFHHLLEGEDGYVAKLAALEPSFLESWLGRWDVDWGQFVLYNCRYALIFDT